MTKDFYQVVLIMIMFALFLFGSAARADAEVISTVIDSRGTNLLAEATPRNGGYALSLNGGDRAI